MSKKIIAIMLTIVMAVAVVATASACTGEPDKVALKSEIVEPSDEVEVSLDSTPFEIVGMQEVDMQVLLGVSTVDTSAKTASQTLTATISPSSAENQNVDWEIRWTDSSRTENISDYLTITPKSDGALTATLTCKKSFRSVGTATVRVTARDGGAYALSIVTFVGNPDSLSMDLSSFTQKARGTMTACYVLSSNSSYDIPVTISNVFNDLADNVEVTMTAGGCGSVSLADYNYSSAYASKSWISDTIHTQALDSEFSANFYTATYSNGNLHIKTKGTVENYYSSTAGTTTGRVYDAFYNDVAGYGGVYGYFRVSLMANGHEAALDFWIYTAVDSVSLDSTSYDF